MESSMVLKKSSLPIVGSPHHHRSIVLDVAAINDILAVSGLSDEDKNRLLASVVDIAVTCAKDTKERYAA